MTRRMLPVALLCALVPLAERRELAADVEEEFFARCASQGRGPATRWLWGQLLRSAPALARRGWWRGRTGFDPRANAMNPGGPLMERWLLEARYAVRRLRSRPTYALLGVLTLALGVGGMTAISGLARALLVDPLPYKSPRELVEFWAGGDWRATEWLALRGHFTGFAGVAAYRHEDVTVEQDGTPTRLAATVSATHELFDVLGVAPSVGRGFVAGEDVVNPAPVVVLSYRLWQQLGGTTSVVGTSVKLDGVQRMVIGVMPRGFWFPDPNIEAWINEAVDPKANYGIYNIVGRVGPGNTIDAMQPAVDNITRQLAAQFTYSPRFDKTKNAQLTSVRDSAVSAMRPALLATLAAMGIILLIACANVAALVLSQVEARGGELAVRAALGADRGRLATQLLIEVLVVGALAGLVGTGFAAVAFNVLRGALPLGAWGERASLDWTLFAGAMTVGLGAAVVVAMLPVAVLLRSDLRPTLSGMRSGGILRRRGGLQGAMVVSEVALAVLLASAAGLLVRSVAKLYAIRPGFDARGVAVLDVAMPANLKPTERRRLLRDMVRDLGQLPGVSSAAVTQRIPLRGRGWSSGLQLPGAPPGAPTPYFRLVSSDYFRALGLTVTRGATWTGAERTTDSLTSVVVNEALVKIYFPGVDPVGRILPASLAGGSERIIGVVSDAAETDLKSEMPPARYFLNEQVPFVPEQQTVLLRTAHAEDVERILMSARQTIARIAPGVAVQDATTMSRVFDRAVGPAREVMTLLAMLTALALVLGAIGIYGVISQFVSRRTHDWGIRVALGLAPQRVVTLVVRHGLSLVLVGIVLGVAGASALARLLSSFLYGVTTTDPLSMLSAALALLVVGALAALIPALRASRTDPAIVLRES